MWVDNLSSPTNIWWIFLCRHLCVWSCLVIHTHWHVFDIYSVMWVDMTTHPSVSTFHGVSWKLPYHLLTLFYPVGSESLHQLAHTIFHSVGPSGPNKVCILSNSSCKRHRWTRTHRTISLNLPNQYINSQLTHLIPISMLLRCELINCRHTSCLTSFEDYGS